MSVVQISHETIVGADALELARTHRAWALQHSPPQDVHAVTAEALLEPGLTLMTARGDDGGLLGMGGFLPPPAAFGATGVLGGGDVP